MDSPVSADSANPHPPKRIIVCCDGTWYAADKGDNNLPSNVARLSRALKKVGEVSHGLDKGQKRAQVVYYQSGVGTGKLGMVDKVWQGRMIDLLFLIVFLLITMYRCFWCWSG
jgi:uncharacterized protein (DUF2235 family)